MPATHGNYRGQPRKLLRSYGKANGRGSLAVMPLPGWNDRGAKRERQVRFAAGAYGAPPREVYRAGPDSTGGAASSARRMSWDSDLAPSFFIIAARWVSTVR